MISSINELENNNSNNELDISITESDYDSDSDEYEGYPTDLDDLPYGNRQLDGGCFCCNSEYLRKLPRLNPTLTELYCHYNLLSSLPENLPIGLIDLCCYNNELTSLPQNLPLGLIVLNCCSNKITALPENLPDTIDCLLFENNSISILPEKLPKNLTHLYIKNNPIVKLPETWCWDLIEKFDIVSSEVTEYDRFSNKNIVQESEGHKLTKLPKNFPDRFKTPELLQSIKENVAIRQAQMDAIPGGLVIKDISNLIMTFL